MCSSTARAEVTLPTDATSPGVARAFARSNGCAEHALEVLDDALLLISELVTNSLRHGGPPIVLAIDCDGEALQVYVRDGSPQLPTSRVAAPDAENGRGLALMGVLSSAWGAEPVHDELGTGKRVWFQLRPER